MSYMSPSSTDEFLIVGGYDPKGAYGPTIFLQLSSIEAVAWLCEHFWNARKPDGRVDLANNPRVRLQGVAQLELRAEDGVGPFIRVRRAGRTADGVKFIWEATSTGWAYLAGLMESFSHGTPGHQYLSSEKRDDALIEVSLGEHPQPLLLDHDERTPAP